MVSKEQKKLNRVINFVKKGLDSLADDLEDVVKSINDFTKSLQKAQKDLKDVTEIEGIQTISTSYKRVAAAPVQAKSAAANTLFSLLSHGEGGEAPVSEASAPTATAGGPPAPPGGGGPPKPPGGGGPPKAPPSGGGPPTRPPAPKLPPSGGGPPKAPSAGPPAPPGGAPAHAKRAGPPTPPGGGAPAVAPTTGGGLGSLRDEMLDELTRLKKIMRGES